ncbi:hypothetical protein AWU68_0304 [Corynebacterium simulans]|nr:hypothetical protein AWU68_0304 [Corynebacterium simulans]
MKVRLIHPANSTARKLFGRKTPKGPGSPAKMAAGHLGPTKLI